MHCYTVGAAVNQGKNFGNGLNDIMPIEIAVYLANLIDKDFLLVISGERLETLCANMNTRTQLLLEFADFVSICFRNTIFQCS